MDVTEKEQSNFELLKKQNDEVKNLTQNFPAKVRCCVQFQLG